MPSWVEGFGNGSNRVARVGDETDIEALPPSPLEADERRDFLDLTIPGSLRRGLQVGDVVDFRYRLLRIIRESGSMRIFVGEHAVTGARLWIEHWLQRPALFRVRARTLATVRHRNALRLLDALTEPMLLVFELPRGTPLAEVIRHHGPFDYSRALRMAERVCWGLHALHKAGAGRIEVSAANIMVTDDPEMAEEPVVIDATADPIPQSHAALNHSFASNRDVGRLLFHMLTAREPKCRDADVVAAELRDRDLPNWLTRFVENLIADDRDGASAQSQASALHDLRLCRHSATRGWQRAAFAAAALVLAVMAVFVGRTVAQTTRVAKTNAATQERQAR